MENILISFFQRVANKNTNEIEDLKECGYFNFEPNQWHFTLPKLYLYLQEKKLIDQKFNYKQFRQYIYNCPINKSLEQLNTEVIINSNKSNVDKTEYSLIWKQSKQIS